MKYLVVLFSFAIASAFSVNSLREGSVSQYQYHNTLVPRTDQTNQLGTNHGQSRTRLGPDSPQRSSERAGSSLFQPMTAALERLRLRAGHEGTPGSLPERSANRLQPSRSQSHMQAQAQGVSPRWQRVQQQNINLSSPFTHHQARPRTPATSPTLSNPASRFQPMHRAIQQGRLDSSVPLPLPSYPTSSRTASGTTSAPWTIQGSRSSSGPPSSYAAAFRQLGVTPPESPRLRGQSAGTRRMQHFAEALGMPQSRSDTISPMSSLSSLPSAGQSRITRPNELEQVVPQASSSNPAKDPTRTPQNILHLGAQPRDVDSPVASRAASQVAASSHRSSGEQTTAPEPGGSQIERRSSHQGVKPLVRPLKASAIPIGTPSGQVLSHPESSATPRLGLTESIQNQEYHKLLPRRFEINQLERRGIVRPQGQNQGKNKGKGKGKNTPKSPISPARPSSDTPSSSNARPGSSSPISTRKQRSPGSPFANDTTDSNARSGVRGDSTNTRPFATASAGRQQRAQSQELNQTNEQRSRQRTPPRRNTAISRSSSLASFRTALSRTSSSDSFHSVASESINTDKPSTESPERSKDRNGNFEQAQRARSAIPRPASSPTLSTPPTSGRDYPVRPPGFDRSPARAAERIPARPPGFEEVTPIPQTRKQSHKKDSPPNESPPRPDSVFSDQAQQSSPQSPPTNQMIGMRRVASGSSNRPPISRQNSIINSPASRFPDSPQPSDALQQPWTPRRSGVLPVGTLLSPDRSLITTPRGSASSLTRTNSQDKPAEEPGWDPMFGKTIQPMLASFAGATRHDPRTR